MEESLHKRKKRLMKIYQKNELHGWLTPDPWIQQKLYINKITNTLHKVSYITKEQYNPLPFHHDIIYVGIIHDCYMTNGL